MTKKSFLAMIDKAENFIIDRTYFYSCMAIVTSSLGILKENNSELQKFYAQLFNVEGRRTVSAVLGLKIDNEDHREIARKERLALIQEFKDLCLETKMYKYF